MTNAPKYTNAQLHFAATARCKCGAGYAYPDFSIRDKKAPREWDCSAFLRGEIALTDLEAGHSTALPFAFYSVKGETQPSAGGATTRPLGPDGGRREFYLSHWSGALEARKEQLHDERMRMRPDPRRIESCEDEVRRAEQLVALARAMGDDDLPPYVRGA